MSGARQGWRLPGWPPLRRSLSVWLCVGIFCALNLSFSREFWPHTIQAVNVFGLVLCVSALRVWPELLWLGWRELSEWQVASLPKLLLVAAYLLLIAGSLLLWILVLVAAAVQVAAIG